MVLLFMSGGEIIVILLVVLLLFGSKRIPELAKGLGKGMNDLKRATNEIKKEVDSATGGIASEVTKFKDDILK